MGENGSVSFAPVFDDDVRRIALPDGNWVEVLRYITEGAQAAALDAARSRVIQTVEPRNRAERRAAVGQDRQEMAFDSGTYQLALLQRLIKAWSFERHGRPIPVTPETIAALPIHTREYIMRAIDEANPVLSEEGQENLERNLPNTSSATDPAQPTAS